MTNWEEYAKRLHVQKADVSPWLFELLNLPNFNSICDFGCGDGVLLKGINDIKPDAKLTGVDSSATRLERLKTKIPGVKTLHADVGTKMDLPEASFDLGISTQVIEHVEDQMAMLREMARLIRPGGKLYLTTVFKKWYGWYFYRCRGKWVIDPTHLREYAKNDELLPDVSAAGFKIIREQKVQTAYSVSDPILRVIGKPNLDLKWVTKVRVPIPGYYNWEIIADRI